MTYTDNAVGMRRSILRELDAMTMTLLTEDPIGAQKPQSPTALKFADFVDELHVMFACCKKMTVSASTSNAGYEFRDLDSDERDILSRIEYRLKNLHKLYIEPTLPKEG